MQFVEIIIFALVAFFLVFKLYTVLGRRTGHERPPPVDPFATRRRASEPAPAEEPDGKVIALPDRSREAAEPVAIAAGASGDVEAGLTQIKLADPQFDPASFLDGAKAAFEMIVAAYAAGDSDTLRPLLSDAVFGNFRSAIDARRAAKQTQETTLIGLRSAQIAAAGMQGRQALVTVRFVSEQVNLLKDEAGAVIQGDNNKIAEVIDVWTFARNTRSRDPNWALVATENPD